MSLNQEKVIVEELLNQETDVQCAPLGVILSLVATGRFALLEIFIKSSLDKALRPSNILEILLQAHLFAGFPRAINALQIFACVLKETGMEASDHLDPEDEPADSSHLQEGRTLFEKVYRKSTPVVLNSLHSLYRGYDRWVLEDAYGRVLSRPQLDVKTRELCAVAALTMSDVPKQLKSHIMGAANTGATPSEIRQVIEYLKPLADHKKIDQALEILMGLNLK